MLRDDLFTLASKQGHQRGKKLTKAARKNVEDELRQYFQTPEGKRDLEDAPRVAYVDRGEDKHRRMTVKDAIAALLEELEAP